MSRFWALFAFLGLLLLHPSPLRAEVAPPPATIEADVVEVDLLGERTYARGDARLGYGDLRLRADELKMIVERLLQEGAVTVQKQKTAGRPITLYSWSGNGKEPDQPFLPLPSPPKEPVQEKGKEEPKSA